MCGLHRHKYLGRINGAKFQANGCYNSGFECALGDLEYRMRRAHMASNLGRVSRMRRNAPHPENVGCVIGGEPIPDPSALPPPTGFRATEWDQEDLENDDLWNMIHRPGMSEPSRRKKMRAPMGFSCDAGGFCHVEAGDKRTDSYAILCNPDVTDRRARRTSLPSYLSTQPPSIPKIPNRLSRNSMGDVPVVGLNTNMVFPNQARNKWDAPPMDPEQGRKNVVEGMIPSFARRSR